MAIKNSLGQIIGVIQLINKFDDLVSFFLFENQKFILINRYECLAFYKK
jgi:hypothetical protein